MKQAHIFYVGQVQGVGFRYTTRSFAKDCHLNGWVKNLDDGRVELIAEGDEEDINQLCRLLEEQFEGFILKKDIKITKAHGKFKDFQIIH